MPTKLKERETIGSRIRTLRKEKGWSQLHLAERCQWKEHETDTKGQARISQYESDSRALDVESAQRIATALGVSIDYLVFGASAKPVGQDNREVPLLDITQLSATTRIGLRKMATSARHVISVPSIVPIEAHTFAVRLSGLTELDDEFRDGDVVIVDPDATPRPGQYVIVSFDGRPPVVRRFPDKARFKVGGVFIYGVVRSKIVNFS